MMNQVSDNNKFLRNFLKQFKGKNEKQIIDSLMVIGADQIISNFKFSDNLPDDIIKASNESSQLKEEIDTLRQELMRLNSKFDDKLTKRSTTNTTLETNQYSPPTKIAPLPQSAKQEQQKKKLGVKKIPYKEKNQSFILQTQKDEQEIENIINNAHQKRIGRSTSLNTVGANQANKKQQSITLKVTEVVPQIPKPVKYVPKHHHLNDDQVKSNFEHYKQVTNIENDQNYVNRMNQERSAGHLTTENNNQLQSQQKLTYQSENSDIQNHYVSNQNQFPNKKNTQQRQQSKQGNIYESDIGHNPNKREYSHASFQPNNDQFLPQQQQKQQQPQQQQQYDSQLRSIQPSNQFNFNVQHSSQSGISGQISPKFNDMIANYHTNQISSSQGMGRDNHSFNQQEQSMHSMHKQPRENHQHHYYDQQQSFDQHQKKFENADNQPQQQIPKKRSTNSHHHSTKGLSKQSPSSSNKYRQKSLNSNNGKKIYYDPRKMKRGDIFDPVNTKREQQNVLRAESKIRGDILERKQIQKQFGKKTEDIEVFVPNQPENGEQDYSYINNSQNNVSQLNNSNNNISYNNNYRQNFYNQQQQQQQPLTSSQQQSQQQFAVQEDSAQFEDRPRQINNYSNNSMNNTFVNKQRSYTATTAATADIRQSHNMNGQSYYDPAYREQNSFNNISNSDNAKNYGIRNNKNGGQNLSASKQFHEESTGSFANHMGGDHFNQTQPKEISEVSPSKIPPRQLQVNHHPYNDYNINQQNVGFGDHQRYDQGEESDLIIQEEDEGNNQNTFIEDSANRQIGNSQYGNPNYNNQQQSSTYKLSNSPQYPSTNNDSINQRSSFNQQNLNQHLTQHYIRSNNQSVNHGVGGGSGPYLNDYYNQSNQQPSSQQRNQERYSHRTENPNNSFQDQSSILQNPFTTGSYVPQKNQLARSRNYGSVSYQQPSHNVTQHDHSGYINTSNMQNPFKDYKNQNPNQQSYLGIDKLSTSHMDNFNNKSTNINIDDSLMNNTYFRGGAIRQSANTYEQQQQKKNIDGSRNSQNLLRQSDQISSSQQPLQNLQNPQKQSSNYYRNLNSSNDKYDAEMKASNVDYAQQHTHYTNNTQNYVAPNRLTNLNSTQLSKKSTEQSPDQQNSTKGQKNYSHISPEHLSNKNVRQSSSHRVYNQDQNYPMINSQGYKQQPNSELFELSASANQSSFNKTRLNNQQSHLPQHLYNNEHETFTARQDNNLYKFSVTSLGDDPTDNNPFELFVVPDQFKEIFQNGLGLKEIQQNSQSRSQTMRSEQ